MSLSMQVVPGSPGPPAHGFRGAPVLSPTAPLTLGTMGSVVSMPAATPMCSMSSVPAMSPRQTVLRSMPVAAHPMCSMSSVPAMSPRQTVLPPMPVVRDAPLMGQQGYHQTQRHMAETQMIGPLGYHPNTVAEAWSNHFEAFSKQDLMQIMDDYDENSHVRVYNNADGAKSEFSGTLRIQQMHQQMFNDLCDLSTLDAPVVDVDEDAGQVFFCWKCPGSGVLAATATYIFSVNYKIWKQNVVLTKVPRCASALLPAAAAAEAVAAAAVAAAASAALPAAPPAIAPPATAPQEDAAKSKEPTPSVASSCTTAPATAKGSATASPPTPAPGIVMKTTKVSRPKPRAVMARVHPVSVARPPHVVAVQAPAQQVSISPVSSPRVAMRAIAVKQQTPLPSTAAATPESMNVLPKWAFDAINGC